MDASSAAGHRAVDRLTRRPLHRQFLMEIFRNIYLYSPRSYSNESTGKPHDYERLLTSGRDLT